MQSFFLNPWILAALGAALLPFIIEWLFRRRKRRVELPTLRFLLNDQVQKKVRRQDRLLLLLRALAIALLVFAVARPLWQHDWSGARQRHVILLLDGTASMQQQADVTTAFGVAQKKAASVIRSLPTDSSVTVVYLGDQVVPVVEAETDLHTAAARVEGLRASAGSAPIHAALSWIKDHIEQRQLDQTELYVFSDFQNHTWLRVGNREETARALGECGASAEIYLIEVGSEPAFNYLVTLLEPVETAVSANIPVAFQVEVQSRGKPPEDARATVTFLVDGVKKGVREVSPDAHPTALEFEHRFPKAGEYLVEALVEGDEHRVDNRRLYLCRVADDLRVLILDDTAETPTPELLYLSRAIRPPAHPGMEKLSHFDVKTINPLRVSYENLSSYAVVVLTGTGLMNEAIASRLERYVADGGALWLFLGDAVNLYDYNKHLYRDGKGLLPCPLGERKTAEKGAHPRYGDTTHPALAQLGRGGGSPEAAVLRYVTLDVPRGSTPVMVFSNGVPAIVEKGHGRGKVLLANMSSGTDWTYLPALPEFTVLVQELLRYLVGNPDAGVNLNVGERFQQPVFVSTQHLLLRYPDGGKQRLRPERQPGRDDRYQVSFADTTQNGLYRIEAIEEVVPRRRFVVNQGTEESDLTRLSHAEFAEAFQASSAKWLGSGTSIEEFTARLHTVTELFPFVVWALTLVLLIESVLAWRFGRRRGEAAI